MYFLSEEPDSLHSDRSPYSFEPASSGPGLENLISRADSGAASVMVASNEDFLIKEHTYKMCPDCPTFSIPIPVPKASVSSSPDIIQPYSPVYEAQHQPSVIDRIGTFLDSARTTLTNMLGQSDPPQTEFQSRLAEVAPAPGVGAGGVSPVLLAGGVAALGVGLVTAALSLGELTAAGRKFGETEDFLDNTIYTLENIDYNTTDILCYPRNYCEKFKRKKYMIDQYPLVKTIGVSVASLIWDVSSVSERGSASLCNLRECVFSLFR